jgi:hypothetical protein
MFCIMVLPKDKQAILFALDQSAEDLDRLVNALPRVAGASATETKSPGQGVDNIILSI